MLDHVPTHGGRTARLRFLLPVAVAAVWLFVARADEFPKNFMVGDFTFDHPPRWEWVEPSANTNLNYAQQLWIPNSKAKEKANVVFNLLKPDFKEPVPQVMSGMRHPFIQSGKPFTFETETNKVGDATYYFQTCEGTCKWGTAVYPGYALAGVFIREKKGNLTIRITGPKSIVLDPLTLKELKAMVEGAMKED